MGVFETRVSRPVQQPARTPGARPARRPPGASHPGLAARPSHASALSAGQEFGRQPMRDPVPAGPTLRVGKPGAASEREAHRTAEAVMAPLPGQAQGPLPIGAAPADRDTGAEAPAIVHEVLRRPGQPLSSETRALMEPRLGSDLGAVRVHTGSLAADSARAVKARAYTVGQDMVFGDGEYAPTVDAGRWLLAHELAHTLQPGAESVVQRFDSFEHVMLGGDDKLILLESHSLDFPERTKAAAWPPVWQVRDAGYDKNQKRALRVGLTYGEVVALTGDLYASFADLNKAPLWEVLELIPLIHSKNPTTLDFQKATGGRYEALRMKNVAHFSGVPSAKNKQEWQAKRGVNAQSNMEVWREQHRLALTYARKGKADLAWGTNAGADHFLTDAFSAGHIRTPRAALMGGGITGMSGDIDAGVLHNLDNKFGVDVVNARGDKWTAYGDKMLSEPPNALGLGYAMEAVARSKLDIADALARGLKYPEPHSISKFRAEELVPKAVNPNKDRWTKADKTQIKIEGALEEAPSKLMWMKYEKLFVFLWVTKTPAAALSRVPLSEKIRLLDVLMAGTISITDVVAIKTILASTKVEPIPRSDKLRMLGILMEGAMSEGDIQTVEALLATVPNKAEMDAIQVNVWDPFSVWGLKNFFALDRLEKAFNRFSPKNYPLEKPDYSSPTFSRPPKKPSWPPEKPAWPPR